MESHMHLKSDRNDAVSDDIVIEWLNEASLATSETTKVENLCKVQEILIHREPLFLSLYLDNILNFALDRNAETRKTVAGFIEEAGEKKPDVIPRLIMALLHLVNDSSAVVVKRALRASGKILKAALKWIASTAVVTSDMETAWNQISSLKIQIINMIDSDNDGIRTQAVKFLEGLILLQTYSDPDVPKKPGDFSLEDIPITLKIARRRKLEEEANHVMDLLVKFFSSQHVSSVNLMTCMGSLALICKQRPGYMDSVIQAIQRVQNDLPPTLSDSQVTSVQKHLKLTLLNLLKHPCGIPHAQILARQLNQLGVKEQEIFKAYPKQEEIKRYNKKRQQENAAAASIAAKKQRLEIQEAIPQPVPPPSESNEITETYIAERLSVEIATELVMDSMAWVPEVMTSSFQREYQPTSTTDIKKQRLVIGKLLAPQIKQFRHRKANPREDKIAEREAVMEDLIKNPTVSVAEVKRERKREKDREKEIAAKASLQEAHEKSVQKTKTRFKSLKLNEVTKPLSKDTKEKMLLMAVKRILVNEKSVIQGGVANIRLKILTTLAATFNPFIKETILDHITEDIRNRIDLALGWLYEEYALLQGFQRRTILCLKPAEAPHQAYNFLLCTLVTAIDVLQGKDRDQLLSRLYLEAPLVTEDAVEALKNISSEESRGIASLHLLKEMVIRRPTKQLNFLNVLLCHTAHESNSVRD